MGFSVFHNLAGTLKSTFRLGRSGPTLRQGTADPNVQEVQGAIDGDVYIQCDEVSQAFYQRRNGVWFDVSTPNVKRVDVTSSTFVIPVTATFVAVNFDGPVDLYLPSGIQSRSIIIKDVGGFASETNQIRIFASSGQTIEGQTDAIVVTPRSSLSLLYGNEWHII